jgi:3-hydroxybutyryl-CoA dehydrogenase
MSTQRPVVVALGAGRMGRGIAHVFAYAGYPVCLLDIKQRPVEDFTRLAEAACHEIHSGLAALSAAGLFDAASIPAIMQRIEVLPCNQATVALSRAAFVFECVPEVLAVKRAAFAFCEPLLAEDAVMASTTSTFQVDTLANMLDRPQRFLNAHWLNPAYLIPLVEMSPAAQTTPAIVDRFKQLLEEIGKVPVICAASPGFIVPRIQVLAMNEAARMVEEGVASAEDIDKAIRFGFGFRFAVLGLLEFIDWGGGDILSYASHYLRDALHNERFAAPAIIAENMQNGKLGMRSAQGFYNFADRDVEQYRSEVLTRFVGLLQHIGAARPPVIESAIEKTIDSTRARDSSDESS